MTISILTLATSVVNVSTNACWSLTFLLVFKSLLLFFYRTQFWRFSNLHLLLFFFFYNLSNIFSWFYSTNLLFLDCFKLFLFLFFTGHSFDGGIGGSGQSRRRLRLLCRHPPWNNCKLKELDKHNNCKFVIFEWSGVLNLLVLAYPQIKTVIFCVPPNWTCTPLRTPTSRLHH